jgi:hypothetical protein
MSVPTANAAGPGSPCLGAATTFSDFSVKDGVLAALTNRAYESPARATPFGALKQRGCVCTVFVRRTAFARKPIFLCHQRQVRIRDLKAGDEWAASEKELRAA